MKNGIRQQHKKVHNLGYFCRDWTITVLMDIFKCQKWMNNVTTGTWYRVIDIKNREWNRTNNKNYNPWKLAFKKILETKCLDYEPWSRPKVTKVITCYNKSIVFYKKENTLFGYPSKKVTYNGKETWISATHYAKR